jgi:Protein of unknown function (DUF3040)
VPLSDHEQRILRQIERQLQQERGLARALRMPADVSEARRNARRASLVFLLGLVLLSVSFATYWLVGLVGFLIMLASAVTLVQSVRRIARDHWGGGSGPHDAATGGEPLSGGSSWGRSDGPASRRWWPGRGGPNQGRGDDSLGEP